MFKFDIEEQLLVYEKVFPFLFVILSFSLIAQEDTYQSRIVKKQRRIADATTTIRLNPSDAQAHVNRAIAYAELRMYESAIADYTTAIRLGADWADIYYRRGTARSFFGEYNSAVSDFTTAIILNSDAAVMEENDVYVRNLTWIKASILSARGNAYTDLGEYNAAIADFTTAIRLNPYDTKSSLHNRGRAKEKAGLPYCSDYKRACELGKCDLYNRKCR